MPSIELDPILAIRVAEEARRLHMTEADFVKDTLERALGCKNPYELLQHVRSGTPNDDPQASESTGQKFAAKLHAQRHP